MAYYIFLKSLRSLEEFRKNSHVKIPPKSPCANFQSLGKFKNLIFLIRKFFFLAFGPADLAANSAFGPAGTRWPLLSRRPKPTHAVEVIAEVRFLLRFTSFALGAFSLPPLTWGTRVSDPSSPPRWLTPVRNSPCLECRRAVTTPPSPPLNSPLKPRCLQWH
jgi:hypothetical protein